MKKDELPDPHDIGLFCPDTVVFQANNITDLIQKFSLALCHGLW